MTATITSDITFSEAKVLQEDNYLAGLLQQSQSKKLAPDFDWLPSLRQQAVNQVVGQNFPTKHDEEWRFTDLSAMLEINFQTAETVALNPEILPAFALAEANQSRIVFVNGVYAAELSDISALPAGVYVGDLAGLPIAQTKKIVKYLGQQSGAEEVFTALNTSGFADLAVIWANPNVVVEKPIHLLFLTVPEESPTFTQPRTLVVAERGSNLQLIECYSAISEGCSDYPRKRPYFTNAVTEIWVEENAQINHSRVQRESGDGFHIGKSAISQARDSRYTCTEVNLGAKLSRHNLEVFQTGEQTETNLNGLTLLARKQVADTHSVISLTKPHGTTNQLHKCIVDDAAHAIFSGKIFVPKAAQLTNAAQLNRNLLLSPKARVNTKPELQITADNVKCSHGATVSQLEADELFYLRSRGLNEYNARHLLIDAFAAEILNCLPPESLRQRLTQCVACRTIE